MGIPPKESEGRDFSHPVGVGKDAVEKHFLGTAMCFPGLYPYGLNFKKKGK